MVLTRCDAGLIALGDKGYHGYGETRHLVVTPCKGRNQTESQKDSTAPTPACADPVNAPTPSGRQRLRPVPRPGEGRR